MGHPSMTLQENSEIQANDNEADRGQTRCDFIIQKKNRKCSMQKKAGFKYCSEHLVHDERCLEKDERVPCPLDPKHSVWQRDLVKHMKKCNARKPTVVDEWFQEDLNTTLKDYPQHGDVLEQDLEYNIERSYEKYIQTLQELSFQELQVRVRSHSALNSRESELTNQKHVRQQSSLIGNLKEQGLLGPENFYMEFGCGKAELSRFVNLSVIEDINYSSGDISQNKNYGFGLIDRGINRMKMDSKIRKDIEENKCGLSYTVKRSRIDIKDLNVDQFVADIKPSKIVAISKHLCGVATDLTLASLINSSLIHEAKGVFNGLLIAMCCRHVCNYQYLLPQSREFLATKGFKTVESFEVLKRLVSWAVDGTPIDPDKKHSTGMSYQEREELGLKARRLVDESRLFALREILKDYEIEMFHYIERTVTPENVCLCIKPRRSIYSC